MRGSASDRLRELHGQPCSYCLDPVSSKLDEAADDFATRDHVLPKSIVKAWRDNGGQVEEPNPPFVLTCRWCNRSKDDLFIQEWLNHLETPDVNVGREDKRRKVVARKADILSEFGQYHLYVPQADSPPGDQYD